MNFAIWTFLSAIILILLSRFLSCNREFTRLKKQNHLHAMAIQILSHDIRSPLQTLVSGTEFIQDYINEKDFEKAKKMMQRYKIRLEETNTLVEQVLDGYRSELNASGSAYIGIGGAILQLVDQLSLYEADDLIVQTHQVPDAGKMEGKIEISVFNNLSVILRNVVSNGIKYSKIHSLSIGLGNLKDNQYIFEIRMLGMGIDVERLHQLYSVKDDITPEVRQTWGVMLIQLSLLNLRATMQVLSIDGGVMFRILPL